MKLRLTRVGDRFSSSICDSKNAKLHSCILLRGIVEDLTAPGDFEIDKTADFHPVHQLRFQQSAGNSTCPQVNIVLGSIRNWLGHQDICNLEAPSRL